MMTMKKLNQQSQHDPGRLDPNWMICILYIFGIIVEGTEPSRQLVVGGRQLPASRGKRSIKHHGTGIINNCFGNVFYSLLFMLCLKQRWSEIQPPVCVLMYWHGTAHTQYVWSNTLVPRNLFECMRCEPTTDNCKPQVVRISILSTLHAPERNSNVCHAVIHYLSLASLHIFLPS